MKHHWQYFVYVLRHKWYVFQECVKQRLFWAGVCHDMSKFRTDEWIPYAEYFYGTGDKQYRQFRFDIAWNHHQKRNPHHWQYWVLREDGGEMKVLPMPDRYRREMLADWRGAGRAINGRDETAEWYVRNRERMLLHADTRTWIERQLGVLAEGEVGE